MNATHNEPAATRIEEVVPKNEAPSRLDAWRWVGVVGFDQYRSHVLAREEQRASRNV